MYLYASSLCSVVVEDSFVIRWRILESEVSRIGSASCTGSTTKQYLRDEHGQCQLHLNIWTAIEINVCCAPCTDIFTLRLTISKIIDICGRSGREIVR